MLARNGAGAGEVLTSPAGPVSDDFIGNGAADISQTPPVRQDRRAQRAATEQTVAALIDLCPESFGRYRPLKRGIHLDLIALGVLTADECGPVMRAYVRRPRYKKALAAGGLRYDLDGNPDGEVTPEEMAGAQRILDQRRTRREERQQQEGVAFFEELKKRRLERETAAAKQNQADAPRRLGLADLKRAAQARNEARSKDGAS